MMMLLSVQKEKEESSASHYKFTDVGNILKEKSDVICHHQTKIYLSN